MRKNYLSILLFFCSITTFFAQLPYQVYYGNLHSHTGNSDGTGDPEDAFTYARDIAGIDFLAVTDHLEQIDPLEWYLVKNEADNFTVNGSFVGIAAWEWGSPLHGHVNVFNTSSIITDATNLWYTTDLPAFINWVLTHAPAFAQFNHPGEESYFTNWNDFTYIDSVTDNAFKLLEIQTIQQATDYYEYALNKGWHLSPVWNQDNHSADWGNKNNGRAGIWATTLSRTALFDAIGAGRTFATMDKNAYVWTDINGTHLGQTINRFANMPFHLVLNDAENEAWSTVELVTNNGVIMSFSSQGNIDTIIPISLFTDMYVFVRAIQADGDYIWSAPVYFSGVLTATGKNFENNYKLYPNPASDYVVFDFNPEYKNICNMRLLSLEGKLILEKHIEINSESTIKIDLPKKLQGLFVVEIENEGMRYFSKLIIL